MCLLTIFKAFHFILSESFAYCSERASVFQEFSPLQEIHHFRIYPKTFFKKCAFRVLHELRVPIFGLDLPAIYLKAQCDLKSID
jgi:hypothetical protein